MTSNNSNDNGATAILSPEKPRRNLTQAFEAMCAIGGGGGVEEEPSIIKEQPETTNTTTNTAAPDLLSPSATTVKLAAGSSTSNSNNISPTSVADFAAAVTPNNDDSPTASTTTSSDSSVAQQGSGTVLVQLPELHLHEDLALELSDPCIQRVSAYSIIHDINKEAASMAAHDPVTTAVVMMEHEKESALVLAALGQQQVPKHNTTTNDTALHAVIDEEQWLLATIAARTTTQGGVGESTSSSSTVCPPTFAQAMGEKEYPMQHSHVARTQLWKPSRSWWEAKSGKNPWIEPASHNKRWRYLWPLIHYHKFLAKCIKKLKRNGVDVKVSISPVPVFLREEVCAVSDHLATVSHFESDSWMECLEHFTGWTVLVSEENVRQYRAFANGLALRSLVEPGDVESPLLRSQIDEAFLRTMQAQRDQMREAATAVLTSVASSTTNSSSKKKKPSSQQQEMAPAASSGPPPMYPRGSPQVPRQIHGVRRPRYYHPNGGWYGWEHPDTSSVHSELSANSSYPAAATQPPTTSYESYQQHMYMMQFYAAHHHHHNSNHSAQAANGSFDPRYGGWMDPAMAYHLHQQGYFPEAAASPHSPYHHHHQQQEQQASDAIDEASEQQQTPFKYDPENMNMSPYWSHLEAGVAAMGLATPAKASPSTPRRNENRDDEHQEQHEFAGAQAPLIRQHYYNNGGYHHPHHHHHHHHPTDAAAAATNGYAPPSPATQFMMSPQASFAYNYGYGFSPRRPRLSKQLEESPTNRSSPSTVETTAESESDVAAPPPVEC